MEYQVTAASSRSENRDRITHYHSSAIGNLICSHTKSTFKSYHVSKENIQPPSQGKLLKDQISELPAEIVVDILSQLKIKEAGSTSILSRQWRYMWTTIYNLDFDGSKVLDDVVRKITSLEAERPMYVNCVNQVIERHQGHTIDQFTIVFDLDESSRYDIDRWVSFALRKRVQRLTLDLKERTVTRNKFYSLPDSLDFSSCMSLTSLHLAKVDVTGEMLQLFLFKCLDLERLIVSDTCALLSLNVDGPPSLKLKWLEVHRCHSIKWLNVSAPNLVSFKYSGPRIPMPLKDVPKLLEISIMDSYAYYLNSRLSELSSYLSQLETLSICACVFKKYMKDDRFPGLPKLKHLTLRITTIGFDSIVDYASLITACPSLYYFSFQTWNGFSICPARERFKGKASTRNMIRVVEFLGFRGNAFEVEMAEYLIKNAVMLEKITFNPISPLWKGTLLEFDETPREGVISARECARQLGKRLRPSVELVIV